MLICLLVGLYLSEARPDRQAVQQTGSDSTPKAIREKPRIRKRGSVLNMLPRYQPQRGYLSLPKGRHK